MLKLQPVPVPCPTSITERKAPARLGARAPFIEPPLKTQPLSQITVVDPALAASIV